MKIAESLPGLAALSLVGLMLSPPWLVAAEPSPVGHDIYQQQCASCHGASGEGVKEKHEGALQGDRTLEGLTRYIDRAMPDEDPDLCVGDDAAAVARYIYDAFYSREAQVRNQRPRVELVRLTNRQYLNTVADLFKHFTGADAAVTTERGLRAVYYSEKDFKRDNKVIERVDRQIDFEFGEGTPDQENFPTNQFSMQWRGALLAEETGDYEFILQTPNGARLWLNDEQEPLIDAWVASGELTEHRASMRLIGGRAYPLRLNYSKFKEPRAAISLQWKPPHGTRQPIPARHLAPVNATPTFVITTPFPPDDSSVGYERGVAVNKAWDEAATHAAIEAANHLARNLDRFSRSKPQDADRAAKVETFCAEFVAAAFRRPLTDEQKRVFVANHLQNAERLEDAVKRVVLLALKSPRFLYLGLDRSKPDDFAVAAQLSFGLWDSLPDRELMRQAARGALRTREQISQQAQRMLADPRTRAKMQYFLHHWLQMNHIEDLAKDDQLFPGFTPEIIADLRTSLNVFLDDALWGGTSDYRTLLLSDALFVNHRLAEFYGLSADAAEDFVEVPLDPRERSGVLTHPYLLAAFSYQKSTSPIHRGVFLTRNIVGRALKPPPVAVAFKDAEFAPNLTMREKVAELTRPQACQSCHSVINPLGFSLEHYDAVGRFRTSDNDRPVNAESDYTTDEGRTIRLTGARDVAEFAARSEQAQNGFIEQLFHQVVKQPMLAYGPDVMSQLRQSFEASEFNLQKLLVEIATLSALHRVEKQVAQKD
ncbi:MAG: DUF1592 domain-containing protein [Verrucomicrobiae bacterium]|nr:DUF1592 domain-containing protein [Verrucomicrobiae bacterium]